MRAGELDQALAAYKRMVELNPSAPSGLLGVAEVTFDMKRYGEAARNAELAAKVADPADHRERGSAYAMLARIALARNDAAGAVRFAKQAQDADPTLPLVPFVQGRLLYDQGRYADALPLFEEALQRLKDRTLTLSELEYYTGDTLARLGRNEEAEAHLNEEVRLFPQNGRAWASLAMLYYSTHRDADVEQTIAGLLRAIPTHEGTSLAAELWTMFGQPERARAVRGQGR
jgi:tetratricopeptide (TPR) repeat protein